MKPFPAKPAGKETNLSEAAYLALRADLLACRLPPGARLNIAELSGRLAVSLGAVREALSRLTAEGLAVAEMNRGFRAAPVSESELLDLTGTRIEIETSCLRRSMAVGGVDWEARIVAAHHRLSRTRPLFPPATVPGDCACATCFMTRPSDIAGFPPRPCRGSETSPPSISRSWRRPLPDRPTPPWRL